VVEGGTKQLLNKGRSVAFQIATWTERIRARKHLVRETDETKYAFLAYLQ